MGLLSGIGAESAQTQGTMDPAGQWTLALGSRTLLVLSLTVASGEGQPFSGSLARPQHFQTSDFFSFTHIYGSIVVEPLVSSRWKDGSVEITVQNPRDPTDKDIFLLKMEDSNHAQLQRVVAPVQPMDLVRAEGTPHVTSDWDQTKVYSPDDGMPSNPEMKTIFEEDQRVRQPGVKIVWSSVAKSDAERRRTVLELLNKGQLHTGEDFTRAAFVFQHGVTSHDFLLAHTLALVALKKGDESAVWIATATLDRYLQSVQQPQIYGTQFVMPKNQPTTQGAYNRTLVPDALRRELGVPAQSEQEEQRKQYDLQRGITK